MTGRKPVTRHLLWGAILVLVGYFVTSFGLLIVVGATPSTIANPYAMVLTVKTALGPIAGNITAILNMCNFIVTPAVYRI
jgi:hypothetical protein